MKNLCHSEIGHRMYYAWNNVRIWPFRLTRLSVKLMEIEANILLNIMLHTLLSGLYVELSFRHWQLICIFKIVGLFSITECFVYIKFLCWRQHRSEALKLWRIILYTINVLFIMSTEVSLLCFYKMRILLYATKSVSLACMQLFSGLYMFGLLWCYLYCTVFSFYLGHSLTLSSKEF